jgi:acyl dehydratase
MSRLDTAATRLGPISVGDELPSFARETGLAVWTRYAAVNDEFVAIHMDDDAGRAAGYPSAFGMGNLQWSYLHNMLEDWLGAHGRVIALDCQFRAPNLKGQTVIARGRITSIEAVGDELRVALEVWTQDQDGAPLAPGTAVVVVGRTLGGPGDLSAVG